MVQTREYESAEQFINEYVEQTINRKDRILLKDLYLEYCESSRYTIGKTTFGRMLRKQGFSVMRSGGNKMVVFYAKSSWL